MSQIGQMRRNEFSSYSTPLESYTLGLLVNEDSIIDFQDRYMMLEGESVVSSLHSYYLKFEVFQSPTYIQDFTIKLKSDDVTVEDVQEIKTFSVKKGTESTIFELIFTPNSTYNQLVFELNRLALDFYISNGDTSGRIMDVKILQFDRVTNVISSYLVNKFSGLKTLKKIGIQGPPGLLFCLDGEEIRIGRSGIYELYNEEITISYLGFIIKESDSLSGGDGKEFFIMDFKY